MAAAILSNTEMLTLEEKIKMVPALLPMLLEGQVRLRVEILKYFYLYFLCILLFMTQPFIDAQDELSVIEFMRKYGMPDRINEEIFIAMGKALDL